MKVLIVQSYLLLFATQWTVPARLLSPWDSPGKNAGLSSHLQGIAQARGSNPSVPHCRQILYRLNH